MDWKTLLADLDAAGFTQAAIAARCGVAQSTVSDLARGATKSPGFDFGQRLIELRAQAQQSQRPSTADAEAGEQVEARDAA